MGGGREFIKAESNREAISVVSAALPYSRFGIVAETTGNPALGHRIKRCHRVIHPPLDSPDAPHNWIIHSREIISDIALVCVVEAIYRSQCILACGSVVVVGDGNRII